MSKSGCDFLKKRKGENFYKKAKIENVRARSYFKLELLDKKFYLFDEVKSVIDLGSAPGSWLEYLDKRLGSSSEIFGIDLLEIKKKNEFSEKVTIFEDDFKNIEEYNLGEFDCVLSDMAPEFSGDSKLDKGRTHKLNLLVLEFCEKHLKKSGFSVFKTFEGEDLPFVRKKAKEIFFEVKNFKPESSSKKSCEVFVLCFNKK